MWADPKKLRRNVRRIGTQVPFNPRVREQLAEQRAVALEEVERVQKPWYMALWAAILALFVRG